MNKARGVLLLTAAIAVGAPAWGHWTAFGEDESKAVWYVDPDSTSWRRLSSPSAKLVER